MAIVPVLVHKSQIGVTATSDEFVLDGLRNVSVTAILTAGSPATGAVLEYTNSEKGLIDNGTALWLESERGNSIVSFAESSFIPVGGVRVKATDGTWTIDVRLAN